MNNMFIYPAVFTPDGDALMVTFPDLPMVITYGEGITHAYEMAKEALGAYLEMAIDSGDKLPKPSAPNKVKISKGGFVSLIDVDLIQFKTMYTNKAIKKTLTIPEWLNNMAESKHINFSAILQKALRDELGIK
jgi:predicted RNase H-like HicB family nuclease